MKVILALPAYNEEQGLPLLLESFRETMAANRYPYHVVAVDDGSRDRTREILRELSLVMPVSLVEHARNSGLGETIRDALRAAVDLAEPGDIVVTMDADNTHSPALIPRMAGLIDSGYGIVIASRYRRGARVVGLSPFRHAMSVGARIIFQLTFPVPGVRDYTCGFRAYRAELLREAFSCYGDSFVTERSFACMAEILLKLSKIRVRIAEVPMVLRYDLKGGASKMNVGRTVIKTIGLLVKLRFSLSRQKPGAQTGAQSR